jgi:hypothetical protein
VNVDRFIGLLFQAASIVLFILAAFCCGVYLGTGVR